MPTLNETCRWWPRLLVCLATAIAVSATAYFCAWRTYRNNFFPQTPQYRTCKDLELLREDIEAHKQKTGDWPARLADLSAVKEKRLPVDEDGKPYDRWRQFFQYTIEGGGYKLCSYGRDRQPGGEGPDADLYAGQTESLMIPPTFEQFRTLPQAILVLAACILAGVVAFPICLLEAKGRRGQRPSAAKFLLGIVVTALFAVLAALMIGALHVMPGGH